MGRPSDEFWSLSYREIQACADQYLDEREERLMLFGTGPAMQLNVASQGKQKWLTWRDIFAAKSGTDEERPMGQLRTVNEIAIEMRTAHAIWNAKRGIAVN